MERILNRIIELRKAKKISQKQIAEHLEIGQAAYAKVESGTSITVDRLFKIAELLNVPIGVLLDIDPTDSDLNKKLYLEIEQLKKRIIEQEEQLNDKRRLVEFLSKNNLLLAVASKLYHDESPIPQQRDFNNLDSLIKQINEMPFDPGEPESQFRYILKRIDELKDGNKK
jgi:transcriptional regulator with XRE-family HTH domain